MRFKLDENLPIELAHLLRQEGHDVTTVADEKLSGVKDQRLAAECLRERRALITFDLDFSDVRTFPPSEYPGLLVLRLVRQDPEFLLPVFQGVLPLLGSETIEGRLWIVEEGQIRIRED